MGNRIGFSFSTAISILVIALLLAVWSFPSFAEQKPDKVDIAIIGDISGPYGPVIGAMVPGAQDAVQYINKEMGGVDGVPLELTVRDNKGLAPLGVKQYIELVQKGPKPLFVTVPHSPTAAPLKEKLSKDGVVGILPSAIECLYPVDNAYGLYALYASQAAAAMKWLKDNWDKDRNPRVAIITWDTAYGKSAMVPQFFEYCKKIGVDIVGQELFSMKEKDLTNHLIRLRSKEPDWLLTNTTAVGPLYIVKSLKELNWDIKLLMPGGGGPATVRLAPALFEDCVTVMQCASYDDNDHPGIKLVKDYMDKYGRDKKQEGIFYILGWQFALTVHKSVSEAVAKNGWGKLDAGTVKDELNKLSDWAPLNGVVKVSYSEKIRSTPWVIIYKVDEGKIVPAGGVGGQGEFVEAPDMTPEKYR
jgi:branched-chain amino acid transport system substrate-binding protein